MCIASNTEIEVTPFVFSAECVSVMRCVVCVRAARDTRQAESRVTTPGSEMLSPRERRERENYDGSMSLVMACSTYST